MFVVEGMLSEGIIMVEMSSVLLTLLNQNIHREIVRRIFFRVSEYETNGDGGSPKPFDTQFSLTELKKPS